MTTTDPDAKAPTLAKQQPDLDAIEAEWLRQCGSCDAGLGAPCTCSDGDPRNVIASLVDEVRRLRIVDAENATQHAKIASLEAKLVVVEKQRDNAQTEINTEVDELLKRLDDGLAERGFGSFDVDRDPVQAAFDALAELAGRAADWQDLADKTREERDEARRRIESQSDFIRRTGEQLRKLTGERDTAVSYAEFAQQVLSVVDIVESLDDPPPHAGCEAALTEARGRLDALVAEVRRLAEIYEQAVIRFTPVDNHVTAQRLREAIAKTAPPPSFLNRTDGEAFIAAATTAPQPELPPDGEGAALIADTEQEIADLGGDDAAERNAWRETARILARALDGVNATLPAQPDGALAEIDRLTARLNEETVTLQSVVAERDAAVKARDEARRDLEAERDGWLNTRKLLHEAITARDESANTIAALHKAADEHTKEIQRLQDELGKAHEERQDALVKIAESPPFLCFGDAVGLDGDGKRYTVFGWRHFGDGSATVALKPLASPTSSATTTEEGP